MLSAAAVARAQDTAPEPAPFVQQKPALKVHKVWTEDDIAALRVPVEEDTARKEVQTAAADLPKPGTATNLDLQPLARVKQPSTLEELEPAIEDLLEDINDQLDTLDRLNKELREVPADQKVERTKEIERRSAVLQESQRDLKALQDRRDALARKAALANSAGRDMTSQLAAPSCNPASSPCEL